MAGFSIPQRIYGTVDYKQARYIFLPDKTIRQALFIDSKAEKENRSATIQMSQTSMLIKQYRSGIHIEQQGLLPPISNYNQQNYLTTTCFVHFLYTDRDDGIHELQAVTLIALPNGLLQARYNNSVSDSIWLAGRNAPTLGEDFRVRVSFEKLRQKAFWRVQTLIYDSSDQQCKGTWQE